MILQLFLCWLNIVLFSTVSSTKIYFQLSRVAATSTSTSASILAVIPPRKRGRPRTKVAEDATPKLKLLDKLKAATLNEAASEQAVYASTTKGGVKLIFDGHLFKFSFRKADYSVFQCVYREHGEECKVRVVCDQKRVYPYDGEHAHFMQASDKSCLPSQFMPGEGGAIASSNKDMGGKVELLMKKNKLKEEEDEQEEFEIHEIDDIEIDETPLVEKSIPMEASEQETVNAASTDTADDTNSSLIVTLVPPAEDVDPNDFREKIKRRLQRALQNKKK
ncbi:blast:Modifier of mdg4 [Drosophila guanche]|uniref:Blast:Modifier of mdg4 n=1 Tax=Drosophila guanche TaxID=7266 RepID=A0A3B0K4I9_DROGU|nr:blast:Modifier of mdg4 [Drosophila guanche]